MRFSLSAAILLACYAILPTSLALDDDIEGGVLRVDTDKSAVPNTLLEPMVSNSQPAKDSGHELQKHQPTIIGGLLQIRQSCPTGYGLCSGGGCCPLGGRCCSGARCCDAGFWCYSTFCCPNSDNGCEGNSCCPKGWNCCKGGGCCNPSQYCTIVNGVRGCCPNGKVCTGNSGRCTDSGYIPCRNDDFCCPAGYTCYRDSNNARRCRTGSGGGGGGNTTPHTTPHTTRAATTTPRPAPTTPTTTIKPPKPPKPPKTTSLPSNSSSASSSATPTQPLPTSRPTVGVNQVSITYQANDNRITWSGTGWDTGSSSCTSNSRRTNTPGESFTLIVPSASKIYLNLDCLNVVYDVYINGQRTTLTTDTFGNPEVCVYKETPLSVNTKNVNVTVVVIGMPMNGVAKRQDTQWQFQLNEIMVVDATNSTSSSSSATTPPQTGGVNGAAGKLEATWFNGFTVVLLAGFGLVL